MNYRAHPPALRKPWLTLAIAALTPVALAQAPSATPDQSDIVIGGDVIAQVGQRFSLDYGDGVITVEMDDWDAFNEAQMINPGETVTVRGEMDRDLFELQTIEAKSVYVEDRGAKYFASSDDEEDAYTWAFGVADPDLADESTWFGISGLVTYIEGSQLTLDTGIQDVMVDTSEMPYNPLDDIGYQQINVGDTVYVSGTIDENLFVTNEVDAYAITSYE
ncbi:MAG: hypothetical protein R3F41_17460 [Gammaproteobacteria bacterium]|nr:hypothetical protein [Pseudomonadales bacterium]MCP5347338.1 hypothetical protein [Pseudomonadales bacterium]